MTNIHRDNKHAESIIYSQIVIWIERSNRRVHSDINATNRPSMGTTCKWHKILGYDKESGSYAMTMRERCPHALSPGFLIPKQPDD